MTVSPAEAAHVQEQGRQFAVAAKLAVFFCALACSVLSSNPFVSAALSVIGYTGTLLERKWHLAGSFLVFQLALGVLLFAISQYGLRMPVFSEFTVLLFWNLYPVFIVAWDLITTPPGEISAFLARSKLPTFARLGLLVVFRFFPTMKAELSSVALSMRNRGLTRISNMLCHPLATCEYVAIPLLLRCLQVADQLTVSAITRGAERPGQRASYYGKRMQSLDIVWILVWVVCLVIVFALPLFPKDILQ